MTSCILRSWLVAWAVAVFLPSALIAGFGLAPGNAAVGLSALPGATWAVADEMGPAAKLLLGGLLLAAFLLVERRQLRKPGGRAVLAMAGAVVAMLATIALLPEAWSRGFASGLSGQRFDPALLAAYLPGALFAGIVFAGSVSRCLRSKI
ncbi:hypothetical protein FJQ54_11315 [Sandaracinobacter neustonicus]|uniref:Uncharacterized protein n=1 Tax=Sandaracinobacter neustonicus TaxID=1715348 RepID=A0A501XJE3_9SPHN|nr:hypothetical protein [Sandaracinobacter neustonicus]TPE60575.1 hypothetical protein FJQ54_11315 [Sandaracinobacter neustonicus]